MNSYQLMRPDGDPSDVWACGQCDRAHVGVIGKGPSASESSRERAEDCCVPRTCGFCGKPTERNAIGDYAPYHDACIAEALRPDFSHASMADPWARLLYRRMSELSEECYFAGWVMGNEFMLWGVMEGSGSYEGGDLSPGDVEELRVLAEKAGGWIWTGGPDDGTPRLVPFAEWKTLVAARTAESDPD